MLREAELARLLTAIDVAVSRAIDAFNIAGETGDEDLTAEARACVERLKAFREFTAAQPTRASRWMHARPPRGESLYFSS
jgi:hypothetical protein